MAFTMPLLFLFERSEAQKNVVKQKHKTVQFIEKNYTIVGAVATIIKDEKQLMEVLLMKMINHLLLLLFMKKEPCMEQQQTA